MRPLFAIAPLALAFALLGPTSAEVSPTAMSAFATKVWHLVFERDASTADAGKAATGRSGNGPMAAAAH